MQTGQLRHQLEQPDDIPVARRLWRVAGEGGAAFLLIGASLAIAARVPAGWFLAGAGAIPMALGWWQVGRVATERARAEIRREERERNPAVLERTIESTRVELEAKLAQLGCATVKEAEQRLQHHRDLARTRVQLEQFLTDQRAGRSDEDIVEQWKTVRRDVLGLQERLRTPEVAARRLTPLQLTALGPEGQPLTQPVSGLRGRERRRSVELERHTVDADALASVEEQLHEAEEQCARAT